MTKLSEKEKKWAFALLALCAIAAAAYVLFLQYPPDTPSDVETFYRSLAASDKVGIFFDMRASNVSYSGKVYQCGVDIISGSTVGSKQVYSYACDGSGCISANSGSNKTAEMTYSQVREKLQSMPYIIVKPGKPSTTVYARHMEISLDESFNSSCRFG